MKKILIVVLILSFVFLLKLSPKVFAWSTETDHGWTCFPAGTKILMSDGSQKNIEEVKVGDRVAGWDGNKQVEETVLELDSPIRDHLHKLFFSDGTTLRLTSEHPLFTDQGWKAIDPGKTKEEMPNFKAGKLVVGDKVFNSQNKYVKIVKMEFIPGNVQTYNLKKVSKNSNFYADSYLAHNKQNTCDTCQDGPDDDNIGGQGTFYPYDGEIVYEGCDYECQTGGGGGEGDSGDAGGGGNGELTTTTDVIDTQTESTAAGGEDFCKELTVDKSIIKTSESIQLIATAKNTEIIKFSYKFYNLDNLDTNQKPKPIKFTSGVNFEVNNNKTVSSDKDILSIPFVDLDKKDLNWNYYMPKPKRIQVDAYFTNTTNKTSKQDNKCRIDFRVDSIDPTPTPNPNCKCSDAGNCATACFFDKFAQGVNYTSPIKCNLPSTLFQSAPTTADKNGWCKAYLRTKGDANGDGKVNAVDYFYFVAGFHNGKVPPFVNLDFNGDNFISGLDRAVLIKSLKP